MALCDLDKAKRIAAAPAPGKSKRKRVQMKRRKARQVEAAVKAKCVGAYSCARSHTQIGRACYIVLISASSSPSYCTCGRSLQSCYCGACCLDHSVDVGALLRVDNEHRGDEVAQALRVRLIAVRELPRAVLPSQRARTSSRAPEPPC